MFPKSRFKIISLVFLKNFIFIIILISLSSSKSKIQFQTENVNKFYSIELHGFIQEWQLQNNTITGGDTILQSEGRSLSYCGENNPTFFCTNYVFTDAQNGILKYENNQGWSEISTEFPVNNNGGYQNYQYFMKEISQDSFYIDYFDGTSLVTIDSLIGEYPAVADIAVDTLGRAWIFVGYKSKNEITVPTKLNVYNQNGILHSYDSNFDNLGAFGSCFINGQLFISFLYANQEYPSSIVPVYVQEDTVELGIPISFPSSYTLTFFDDLASWEETSVSTVNDLEPEFSKISIYPNPVNHTLFIKGNVYLSKIEIYSMNGRLIKSIESSHYISTNEMKPGLYFVVIEIAGRSIVRKFTKI